MTPDAVRFERALMDLDRLSAQRLLAEASRTHGLQAAIDSLVIPALENIGERFEKEEIALSQKYMAGRICEQAVEQLLPPAGLRTQGVPLIGLATLEDHHYLGKKIVYLTLRASGFEVMDFGMGISVEDLVKRTLAGKVNILLISVLMLPAALKILDVRRALDAAGQAGQQVKIICGGAPFRFDPALGEEVGADLVASDSSGVIAMVSGMMEEIPPVDTEPRG